MNINDYLKERQQDRANLVGAIKDLINAYQNKHNEEVEIYVHQVISPILEQSATIDARFISKVEGL